MPRYEDDDETAIISTAPGEAHAQTTEPRTRKQRYAQQHMHKKISKRLQPRKVALQARQRPPLEEIQDHWQCKLKHILPPHLRPSVRQPNGKPIGYTAPETRRLGPREWTMEFTAALLLLSRRTNWRKEWAQKRLLKQVKARQTAKRHSEYYAAELLTSDVRAVIGLVERLSHVGRIDGLGKRDPHSRQNLLEDIAAGEDLDGPATDEGEDRLE